MDVQPIDIPLFQWIDGVWLLGLAIVGWGVLFVVKRLRFNKGRHRSVGLLTMGLFMSFVFLYVARDVDAQKKRWKLSYVNHHRQFWDRYFGIPLGRFDSLGITLNGGTEIAVREFQISLLVVEAYEVVDENLEYRVVRCCSRTNPSELIEFHFFPASGWRERLPEKDEQVVCYFHPGRAWIQDRYLLGSGYQILTATPPKH